MVAPRAVLLKKPLAEKLWTWTEPFHWTLWLVLLGSVLVSGVVFWLLEEDSRLENDFTAFRDAGQQHSNPRAAALGHSLFLSAIAITTVTDHNPTTFPARVLTFVKTFTMWILMAAYLANFSAGLATKPKAFQKVTGFATFSDLGLPLCVRNNAVHLQVMAAVYPAVPLTVVGPATTDVLDAVLNGTCAGGMGNDLELRWAMGAGDVQAKYCPLEYVGDPSLATFQFGVPIHLQHLPALRRGGARHQPGDRHQHPSR